MTEKYESYKPSGIPWIREIPSHWDTMRIKFYCDSISSGATPSTNVAGYWDGYIPWIPSGCCHDCNIDEAPKFITKEGLQSCSTQIIPASTTVMAMTGATCSQVGFLTIDAATNQSVMAYRENKKKADAKFLFYLLQGAREYILTHQTGGAQAGINGQDCSNLLVPLIPIEEQKKISSYLDRRCAAIDRTISTQEKKIRLLEKLKINVISSATFQGLYSTELKATGIAWMPLIPKHWKLEKVSRVFNYAQIGSGTTPKSSVSDYYDENGYNWLQTGDLNDGIIIRTSKKVSSTAIKDYNLKFYPKQSIVIAMYGATIGKVGILGIETSTNQACCVLPPSQKCLSKFAFYYFIAAKPSLLIEASGGGQPNISQDVIRQHRIALPPIDEQQAIVHYLDNECAPIDAAIEKAHELVKKLKNYKKSLITEVVTGKRKVC